MADFQVDLIVIVKTVQMEEVIRIFLKKKKNSFIIYYYFMKKKKKKTGGGSFISPKAKEQKKTLIEAPSHQHGDVVIQLI